MAAEANAAKLQEIEDQSKSMPNLTMTNELGIGLADIPLHGSLPDINSPGAHTLSLAEEAKNKKLLERDQRLALGREQQAKREKEKDDMYFWRKNIRSWSCTWYL